MTSRVKNKRTRLSSQNPCYPPGMKKATSATVAEAKALLNVTEPGADLDLDKIRDHTRRERLVYQNEHPYCIPFYINNAADLGKDDYNEEALSVMLYCSSENSEESLGSNTVEKRLEGEINLTRRDKFILSLLCCFSF